MKSKSNHKPIHPSSLLKIDWETLTNLQGSLRKVCDHSSSLPMDHQYLDIMKKFAQQLMKTTESLKAQEKQFLSIKEDNIQIQAKLANHNNIIKNLQNSHLQRLKAVTQEVRSSKQYYEKAKKSITQTEQNLKGEVAKFKQENKELKYKIQILQRQKEQLNKAIESKCSTIEVMAEQLSKLKNLHSCFEELSPRQPKQEDISSIFQNILCSKLGSRIANYLSPPDIFSLQMLTKNCRLYLVKSKSCRTALAKSVMHVKDKVIKHYHRHIDYFQKLYHKIPQEILQIAFYRYEIKKQNIGSQILGILNSSAMLFQGKFTDVEQEQRMHEHGENNENQQVVVIGGMVLDIEKQLKGIQEINEDNILEIDSDIVKEFLEERKHQKQKISQQINLMYKKIQDTAQLYSADVESIGLFLKNVLKNFSKVFVLSKNLYTEARHLQSLNTFILRELSGWEKIQVQKNSIIEDLKAELEAERKLKIYFTEKSLKSEQRALSEENTKLVIEVKFQKKSDQLNQACKEKDELLIKMQQYEKDLKRVKGQNREIRRAYENGKQKYNKIIEQLSVVKETILRMNLM